MKYPAHLERHKRIYERHQAGETYVAIAHSLNLTAPRVRQIALRWEEELEKMQERNHLIEAAAKAYVALAETLYDPAWDGLSYTTRTKIGAAAAPLRRALQEAGWLEGTEKPCQPE